MDTLWNACFAAVAVMMGVPLLAATLGLCTRWVVRFARRRQAAVQLSLPLASISPGKLQLLRQGLGVHG